ncbi:MAG TPA: PAS domain S-box protein, partial [Chitinophagaceae bacterium]|nr:PAS domain S-box protein [Chitinophagaceae bacterium]
MSQPQKTKINGLNVTARNGKGHLNGIEKNLSNLLLDTVPSAILYVCQDQTYNYVNKTYSDWFGVPSEHIIGKSLKDFLGNETFASIRPYVERALGGETVKYEDNIPYKNGTRSIEATCTPDMDEDGYVKGYVAILNDVTEMKLASEHLKTEQGKLDEKVIKREAQYTQLFKSLPVAVYTCNKEGKITFFNHVATELWGYTPDINDDALRFCACYKVWMPDGTFVPPDKRPMAVALSTGQSFRNVEAIVQRPNGEKFHAIVNIDPLLDEEGNIRGAINIFQDISYRKNAETALRESE